MHDTMPNRMRHHSASRLLLAAIGLVLGVLLCVSPATAQSETPANTEGDSTTKADKPLERDGHDRPTTYPKIHFGKKKADESKADGTEDGTAEVGKKLKTRVYLLDVSAVMSKSITVNDTRETTRLEHMTAQMESSLDYLVNRKDPRLRFNIVTFGSVQDFASGGELKPATADNAKSAKEWLKKLEAKGNTDIYNLLKECFEQEPDSATMLVGGLPCKPAGVAEAELAKHKDAGEFVIAQVKAWRKAGKTTTLDITGVGLSEDERAYYKRLAEAAGGTYLDA